MHPPCARASGCIELSVRFRDSLRRNQNRLYSPFKISVCSIRYAPNDWRGGRLSVEILQNYVRFYWLSIFPMWRILAGRKGALTPDLAHIITSSTLPTWSSARRSQRGPPQFNLHASWGLAPEGGRQSLAP
jgi:hypothetical protein